MISGVAFQIWIPSQCSDTPRRWKKSAVSGAPIG
jgi:hypothetical protein